MIGLLACAGKTCAGVGAACGMDYGAFYALALLLLALGMGSKVCAKSETIQCSCGKKVSMAVGWIIMALSILSLVCLGWRCFSNCKAGKKFCQRPGVEQVQDAAPVELAPVAPTN